MSAIHSGRVLRPAQAAIKLGIGLSTLWRYTKSQSDFPQPIHLSPRVTVFMETHLDEYLAKRAAESKQAA